LGRGSRRPFETVLTRANWPEEKFSNFARHGGCGDPPAMRRNVRSLGQRRTEAAGSDRTGCAGRTGALEPQEPRRAREPRRWTNWPRGAQRGTGDSPRRFVQTATQRREAPGTLLEPRRPRIAWLGSRSRRRWGFSSHRPSRRAEAPTGAEASTTWPTACPSGQVFVGWGGLFTPEGCGCLADPCADGSVGCQCQEACLNVGHATACCAWTDASLECGTCG
jgi:hypothetical protein